MRVAGMIGPKGVKELSFWLDVVLIGCTLAAFAYWSELYRTSGAMTGSAGAAVGKIVEGSGYLRRAGGSQLTQAQAGAAMEMLDTVWVPKKGSLTGELGGKLRFKASESTLFIVKAPFRHIESPRDNIHVIRGSVDFLNDTDPEQSVKAKSKSNFVEIPDEVLAAQKPEPVDADGYSKIFPKPGSMLVVAPPSADQSSTSDMIKFGWFENETGYLALKNLRDKRVNYYPILAASTVDIRLRDRNTSYVWQVVDKNRQITKGPFVFDARPYETTGIDQVLKGKPKQPIELELESPHR